MTKKTRKPCTELPDDPTLEDVLQFLHGSGEKMLLKEVRYDKDGYVAKWGTELGERTYGKLVALLYGVGTLVGCEDYMEDVVESLDAEARGYVL